MFRAAVLFALAVITASTGTAQSVAIRDLPKPARELSDPFTLITGATEIAGGRLVVMDGGDGLLALVDFQNETKTSLGRQGSGPGEYKSPSGIFRLRGDTLWALDAAQMRIVAFLPDMKAGTAIPFMMFDQATSTALAAPFFSDRLGRVYSSALNIQFGRGNGGGSMQFGDSVAIVRIDPRATPVARTEFIRVRFPTSGKPEIKQVPGGIKYTMAYPGLVASDPWAVFPDGRIAVVRGADYTVQFLDATGKKSNPVRIAFDRIKVTDADRKAEMDEARRLMVEQGKAAQRLMPSGMKMEFDLLPPASWPEYYPPIAPLGALAGPDGRLWVRRSIPVRLGREQWDVIDASGKLVARWRLPAKTSLVAVGQGAVYTVRTDEDDLRYVQRVEIPR